MKYSPKYNITDNFNSTIEIIDTRADTWNTFEELMPRNDCIATNNSSIKVSKRKLDAPSKFYDTLWIRKEDGCLKISGNRTLKLEENEFQDLIEEMIVLLKEGVYTTSELRQEVGWKIKKKGENMHMGLTCKPVGKTRSITRKLENKLAEEAKLQKEKKEKKTDKQHK